MRGGFLGPLSGVKLQSRQPRVHAALGYQFRVRALLDQTAPVNHHNAVGFLHRGQAVGNDQRGAVFHEAL